MICTNLCSYQEVVCEAPHPPVSQDCPEDQAVSQDGDNLQCWEIK